MTKKYPTKAPAAIVPKEAQTTERNESPILEYKSDWFQTPVRPVANLSTARLVEAVFAHQFEKLVVVAVLNVSADDDSDRRGLCYVALPKFLSLPPAIPRCAFATRLATSRPRPATAPVCVTANKIDVRRGQPNPPDGGPMSQWWGRIR